MLISVNWLKDYVDLEDVDIDRLVKRFNLATAEIESVVKKGENIENVVFAKVLEVAPVEGSDHLHLLKVDAGENAPIQVVCGAPNVKVGMITAFAKVGARVGELKIRPKKTLGVESFGMCCGETELGIGSDDTGIMDILEPVKIGQDIKKHWPIDDIVFEIENKTLTNRPDLWGHLGIAREVAALLGKKLKKPEVEDLSRYSSLKKIPLKIETKDCLRYSAVALENVTCKTSPVFMKIRLNYCGMRDINFAADLTNFVMLDLGQPMHAFDFDKVKEILVDKAENVTKLLTLEGEEHEIPEGAIVICDGKKKPVAIAGIKGGLLASISPETSKLLIESAVFDATAVRVTSKKLGLSTDASQRYEKSLDPAGTIVSLARLVSVLKKVDPKARVCTAVSDIQTFSYPPVSIELDTEFVRKKIGTFVSDEKIVEILRNLQFEVKKLTSKKSVLDVKVPTFRATKDVSIKEDLVEEVARVFGYDKIQPTSLSGQLVPVVQSHEHVAEYKTKRLLAEKFGVTEVHSYVWNFSDFNREYGIDTQSFVRLQDSSNSGQAGVRSALVPSLLKFFAENKNSVQNIRMCEIGRIVSGLENNLCIEEKRLAVLFSGELENEEKLLFELKKAVVNIAESVALTELGFEKKKISPWIHPVNSINILVGNKVVGELGLLHPSVSAALDKRFAVAVAEINFSELCNAVKKTIKVQKPSKFQSVHLDFNFLVPLEMPYLEFEKLIKGFNSKLIEKFKLKDVFESEKLKDQKSFTIGFEICAHDHTLDGAEIEKFSSRLIEHMAKSGVGLKK